MALDLFHGINFSQLVKNIHERTKRCVWRIVYVNGRDRKRWNNMLTRQLLTYRIDLVGSVPLAFVFTLADAFESTVVGQFPIRLAFWLLMIIPLWLTTSFFIKLLLSRMGDETLLLTTTLLVMATTVTFTVAAV